MKFSAKNAGKHLVTPREDFSMQAGTPAWKNPHVSLITGVFSGGIVRMLHTVKAKLRQNCVISLFFPLPSTIAPWKP
jgi:hypothetical protein